ncbi:MAG: endopeptidase La, partial [Calditrichaeota bacterium]
MEKQLDLLEDEEIVDIPDVLPLIPIREMVIFPDAIVPLLVGREKSVRAVQTAQNEHGLVLLTTQKQAEKEIVETRDLYRVGTVARILQVMSLPNGYHKIVVEALTRARIVRFHSSKKYFKVQIEIVPEIFKPTAGLKKKIAQLLHFFEEYLNTNPDLP